jgi:hypothetical protein
VTAAVVPAWYLPGMDEKEPVLVKSYILPEVFDRLERLAFESHRSVAAELRVAIDEHLKNTGAK